MRQIENNLKDDRLKPIQSRITINENDPNIPIKGRNCQVYKM